MFNFSSGLLWATPLQDATGAAIAAPTPLICGTMQDAEFDFKFELKKLHGQNQFAVAVGRGKGDLNGKAKVADIRAAFLETVLFGQTAAAGLVSMVYDTVGAQVPAAPHQITVAPPSGGAFDADLGVIDSTTGRELKRVSAGPTAGQYAVTAGGQYTFAAADLAKVLYMNYRFTAASSTAKKIVLRNLPMGYAPSFRADFYGPYQGQSSVFTLNKCIADGWKFSSKNDDFTVPEFGFSAQVDAAGIIGTLAFTE